MHVFYVQGGGLGHLTRIDKLIKTLNIQKDSVKIITPSVFTSYFKTYQFVTLSWKVTPSEWTKQISQVIATTPITTFYIDTFPFGLKGELEAIYSTFPNLNYVYVSRILKWETYLQVASVQLPIAFTKSILLENLYDTHLQWIIANSKACLELTLKTEDFTPIPFLKTPYVMVVHSGGIADVLKICKQAINENSSDLNLSIVVFTQVDITIEAEKVLVYTEAFPVNQYYQHAQKIYTAAGFNSIQELKSYKGKHVAIPLEKLYDDQFFRVSKL
ncbi:hypothetical protein [Lacinutrix salivirga]